MSMAVSRARIFNESSYVPIGESYSMANEVVAVFGAHPDDLDWACGGTAAVWTREGKEVYYVLTTSGESGEDHQRGLGLPPTEIAEIREAEQRLAPNILGVTGGSFFRQSYRRR